MDGCLNTVHLSDLTIKHPVTYNITLLNKYQHVRLGDNNVVFYFIVKAVDSQLNIANKSVRWWQLNLLYLICIVTTRSPVLSRKM